MINRSLRSKSTHEEVEQSVRRAIRALKGSESLSVANVAKRAAMYCNTPRHSIEQYINQLDAQTRIEFGLPPSEEGKRKARHVDA